MAITLDVPRYVTIETAKRSANAGAEHHAATIAAVAAIAVVATAGC